MLSVYRLTQLITLVYKAESGLGDAVASCLLIDDAVFFGTLNCTREERRNCYIQKQTHTASVCVHWT